LRRIASSIDRAARLTHDILDFTQVRMKGALPMKRAPMDLLPVVQGIIGELASTEPTRDIVLSAEGDTRGDWDRDRLSQVVFNLLVNALKYSPQESSVRVELKGTPGSATVEVLNAGTLAPDLEDHLFDPLRRSSMARDTGDHSIGLGLFIVQHIVRSHGGTIEVRSEGGSTSFLVTLPRTSGATAPAG
jgi:signal transduction histidine kinase